MQPYDRDGSISPPTAGVSKNTIRRLSLLGAVWWLMH